MRPSSPLSYQELNNGFVPSQEIMKFDSLQPLIFSMNFILLA